MPTKPPEVKAALRDRHTELEVRLRQLQTEARRLVTRLASSTEVAHSFNRTQLQGSLVCLERQISEVRAEQHHLLLSQQQLSQGQQWAQDRLQGKVVPTPRRALHRCPRCEKALASVHHETKMVCGCGWSESSTFRTEGGGEQQDYYEDHHVGGVEISPEDLAQVGSAGEGVDAQPASPTLNAPSVPTEPFCNLMRQWQGQQTPPHILKQLADQYRKYCHVPDPFCVQSVLTKNHVGRLRLPSEWKQAGERLSRELRGDAMPCFTETEIEQFKADAEHFPPAVYQDLQPHQVVGVMGRRLGLEQARLLPLGRTEDPIRPKIWAGERAYAQHWADRLEGRSVINRS